MIAKYNEFYKTLNLVLSYNENKGNESMVFLNSLNETSETT